MDNDPGAGLGQMLGGLMGGSGGSDNFLLVLGLGFAASTVGWLMFKHGKNEQAWLTMCTGLSLMIYPYFIRGLTWNVALPLAILASYFVARRFVGS